MKAILAVCFLIASAKACDVSCSSFSTENACTDAFMTTCALCSWEDKYNNVPGRCFKLTTICQDCTTCRKNAGDEKDGCTKFKNQDACEKLNKDSCVVCGWSNGKCAKSSCSASCSNFKTETTCKEAMSGVCPYDCKWDDSEAQCEGSLERAVEGGLKTFVIIIIVVIVLVVLGIVACIVCCCCCTGAAAASAMNKKSDTMMMQQQAGYVQQQQ